MGCFLTQPNWIGVCTNASGEYTVSGLPLGVQARVSASPNGTTCGQWTNYIEEFWPESNQYQSAEPVILTAEVPDLTNINFTLDVGGQISGTTFASNGVTPLPHIAVSLVNDQHGYVFGTTCSDEHGQYTSHGVPFNLSFRIRADAYQDAWCDAGGSYNSEYYGETLNDGPTLVTLTDTDDRRAGIDFSMSGVEEEILPWLGLWYKDGILDVIGLPENTHLKLRIEDYSTPQSPDFFAEKDVPSNGHARFDMGLFKVMPGMFAYVSGAYRTYIIHVVPLEITSVDPVTDTVRGTASPYDVLWLDVDGNAGRLIDADGNGNWNTDFSVLGPHGEPIADIKTGSTGLVLIPSGDGSTNVSWAVPATPSVLSITRGGANPTNAAVVDFNVTFSESVVGVDRDDFSLTTNGISGASISAVSGSGDIYTITADTGSGSGTIRLDVVDNNSILDLAGDPLGGPNSGDGDFTGGEIYTIEKIYLHHLQAA